MRQITSLTLPTYGFFPTKAAGCVKFGDSYQTGHQTNVAPKTIGCKGWSFPFGLIIFKGVCKVCFGWWYRIAADYDEQEEEEEEFFQ